MNILVPLGELGVIALEKEKLPDLPAAYSPNNTPDLYATKEWSTARSIVDSTREIRRDARVSPSVKTGLTVSGAIFIGFLIAAYWQRNRE